MFLKNARQFFHPAAPDRLSKKRERPEERTPGQKLDIVREFLTRSENISVKEFAKKHSIFVDDIYSWLKDETQLLQSVDDDVKKNYTQYHVQDPLIRIKHELFYHFEMIRKYKKMNKTNDQISKIAMRARNVLLADNALHQFLNDSEVNAMLEFEANESFCQEVAVTFGWRKNQHKLEIQIEEKKKEIKMLQKIAIAAENRARELENENGELFQKINDHLEGSSAPIQQCAGEPWSD